MIIKSFCTHFFTFLTGKLTFSQAYNSFIKNKSKESITVKFKPTKLEVIVTSKNSSNMNIALFKDILKKNPASANILLSGDKDPFLNQEIFEMVQHAKSKRKKVTISSDGLLMNQYLSKIFKYKVDEITININAINPVEFKRLTNQDETVFKDCLESIRNLIKLKQEKKSSLVIHLTLFVDKLNYQTMPEMISFAEELGVNHVSLRHFTPYPANSSLHDERLLYISDTDAAYLIEELALGKYSVDVTFPRMLDGNPNNRLCNDSMEFMSIDRDGVTGGCHRQLLNNGNQGKYSDNDFYNNDHFKSLRRIFLGLENELKDPCKTCYNNTTYKEITIKAKKHYDKNF